MSLRARISRRSTVSPQVRHGAGAASAPGRGALPAVSQVRGQGVEVPQFQIGGECPRQRGVARLGVAARQPDHRHQEVVQRLSFRRPAEHVQAAADLHLLQLAQVVVQLGERGVVVVVGLDAAVPVESDVGGQGQDLLAQHPESARVHAGGLEVLVDEQLQLRERSVGLGPGERRGEVVDDDRLRPALGLGALAGVVDDERVEVRQRPEDRFGKARLVQRQRLARQPFEVAVLARMDDGVHVLHHAQPRVEREVAVRRHQVGVVVRRLRIDVVAARGLQPDDDVAAR